MACTQPTTSGYNFASAAGSEKPSDFSVAGITCEPGYIGEARAAPCCTGGEPYKVTGCFEAVCTKPETVGYIYEDAKGTFTPTGFRVDGITCQPGYAGNQVQTAK